MEDTIIKDRASEIAEEKLAEIAKQKTSEESKGASEEKSSTETPSTDDDKTKGSEKEKKAEDSESELREDNVILEMADDELNEAEQAKKKELIQKQEDAKSPEDKLKEWQDKTQKRIDELMGALKAEQEGRRQDADTIKILENSIAGLTSELEDSGSLESEAVKDEKVLKDLYAKMVDEDKDLPRESRREMSEDELEEWMLEDMVKAQQWLVRREIRHDNDKAKRANSKKVTRDIDVKAKTFFADYPDCDKGFKEQKRLVDGGMSEALALEEVSKTNKDYALMMEIFKEDKKYSDPTNGPDLMAKEMKKRKAESKDNKEVYTKEEVDQMLADAAKAEQDRIASIDTGIKNSGVDSEKLFDNPIVKQQWNAWVAASKRPAAKASGGDWSKDAFLKSLKRGVIS